MGKRVWLWRSPDGVMVFGSAKRAKDTITSLFPDVTVWCRADEATWEGFKFGNSEGYPEFSIYAEEVM